MIIIQLPPIYPASIRPHLIKWVRTLHLPLDTVAMPYQMPVLVLVACMYVVDENNIAQKKEKEKKTAIHYHAVSTALPLRTLVALVHSHPRNAQPDKPEIVEYILY